MPTAQPAYADEALQFAFRALADPTRRRILTAVADQPRTVGDVAARFAMTRAAVRKHLTVLEEGGLIDISASGRERHVALRPEALKAAHDWIGGFSRFWDERLAALQTLIDKEEGDET